MKGRGIVESLFICDIRFCKRLYIKKVVLKNSDELISIFYRYKDRHYVSLFSFFSFQERKNA